MKLANILVEKNKGGLFNNDSRFLKNRVWVVLIKFLFSNKGKNRVF
jgi:hypothetical protein